MTKITAYIGIALIIIGVLGLGFSKLSQTFQNKQILTPTPSTISQKTPQPEKPTEHLASFAIFTNGTFRIFTASMYHNLSPDVFIQKDNPNIVYVKKDGLTWDDFFKTLPMKLDQTCLTTGTKQTFCTGQNGTLKFYLNGEKTDDALQKEIKQGDKLLVSFGPIDDPQVKTQLTQIPNTK